MVMDVQAVVVDVHRHVVADALQDVMNLVRIAVLRLQHRMYHRRQAPLEVMNMWIWALALNGQGVI